MCLANRESLEVSYLHLSKESFGMMAAWLADAPAEMLKIFDEVAYALVMEMFPEYNKICPEVHVRITDLPINDSLRGLRQLHLNCFVKVSGVVTRRTSVFPQLKSVKYDCQKCGFLLGPYMQSDGASGMSTETRVGSCPNCQSRGPFAVNIEETIYRNYQKITLQESPGSVPPGRLPRTKEIILLGDLIDTARPGEEIVHNFDALTWM